MFCSNCGTNAFEGDVFCQACGRRLEPAKPVISEAFSQETTLSDEPISTFPEISDSMPDPTASGIMEEANNATETDPLTKAEQAKEEMFGHTADTSPRPQPSYVEMGSEKLFFGRGAFALCLVAIGILAITTGVFAGLYFNM